jgi:matrixin
MRASGTDRPSTAMEGTSPHRAPRPVRGRATLLVVLVALLVAALPSVPARADAPAPQADPALLFPAGGPAIETALDVGAARWGAMPCRGDVTTRWATLAPAVNAQARWSNSQAQWDHPEFNQACEVVLNRAVAWDWPKLCTVVVHELGHLMGHDHTGDEDDIMFPYYVAPSQDCSAAPVPAAGPGRPATARSAPRSHRRAGPRRVAKRRAAGPRGRRAGRSSRSHR